MPSLPDTAVIIILGLLLFGPKGLAQIARQLGKLMGEFRRASNEFRMQMEEELRIAEQADRQKEITKIEAAAPVTPELSLTPEETLSHEHLYLPKEHPEASAETSTPPEVSEPLPIATSGDLSIMPPATGLPEARSSSLASLIDSVPKADPSEALTHDAPEIPLLGEDQRPMRYTNHRAESGSSHNGTTGNVATEESIHG